MVEAVKQAAQKLAGNAGKTAASQGSVSQPVNAKAGTAPAKDRLAANDPKTTDSTINPVAGAMASTTPQFKTADKAIAAPKEGGIINHALETWSSLLMPIMAWDFGVKGAANWLFKQGGKMNNPVGKASTKMSGGIEKANNVLQATNAENLKRVGIDVDKYINETPAAAVDVTRGAAKSRGVSGLIDKRLGISAELITQQRQSINQLQNHAGSMAQYVCLLYTSPSPRDQRGSRMPSSA